MAEKRRTRLKYPEERVIMNKEKNMRFITACSEIGLPKSRVLNCLIDLLLQGKIVKGQGRTLVIA